MNIAEAIVDNAIDLVEFKARLPEILEQLSATGVVITKEGHPLARVTPLATVNNAPLIGSMKGQISIKGDIFSTGLAWDAQS